MLVQLSVLNEYLFPLSPGTETPTPGISLPVHDDSFEFGGDAVIASGHFCGGHGGDGHSNGLSLGGDDDTLGADFDVAGEAQDSGQHELGAVADGVDGAVFGHDARVVGEESLERQDDSPEVGFVLVVFVFILGVQHVVHRAQIVVLGELSTSHSSQLLHVSPHSAEQSDVLAHGSDVGARLAGDPEHSQVLALIEFVQFGLVNSPDSQLLLHRRNRRRLLEHCSGQLVQNLL